MLVLHNPHDKKSRDFVEAHTSTRDIVLDWYNQAQQDMYLNAGGTILFDSFPVVVIDNPDGGTHAFSGVNNLIDLGIKIKDSGIRVNLKLGKPPSPSLQIG